jgi:coproporphyrinogen III oxidase
MYDYATDIRLWTLNMPVLSPDVIRSTLKDALNDSSHVLAAIRNNYVFVYNAYNEASKVGKATLLSIEEGNVMSQVSVNIPMFWTDHTQDTRFLNLNI